MFYKKACPVCNHANHLSHFRSKFSLTCQQCGTTMSINGGGFVNFWIETLAFVPVYLLIISGINAVEGVLNAPTSELYRLAFGAFAAWVLHGFLFPYLAQVKVHSRPTTWRLF